MSENWPWNRCESQTNSGRISGGGGERDAKEFAMILHTTDPCSSVSHPAPHTGALAIGASYSIHVPHRLNFRYTPQILSSAAAWIFELNQLGCCKSSSCWSSCRTLDSALIMRIFIHLLLVAADPPTVHGPTLLYQTITSVNLRPVAATGAGNKYLARQNMKSFTLSGGLFPTQASLGIANPRFSWLSHCHVNNRLMSKTQLSWTSWGCPFISLQIHVGVINISNVETPSFRGAEQCTTSSQQSCWYIINGWCLKPNWTALDEDTPSPHLCRKHHLTTSNVDSCFHR